MKIQLSCVDDARMTTRLLKLYGKRNPTLPQTSSFESKATYDGLKTHYILSSYTMADDGAAYWAIRIRKI